jgi:O-acetyl-ADP-ribose deacetylase (regulator of RNase III)
MIADRMERLVVKTGDITCEDVDAIVNAANSTLLGGGGVDGAIHAAGGAAILAACRAIRESRFPHGMPTGEAVITTGGLLCARHVIHTVGPIYGHNKGRDADLLASCYRRSLEVAAENGLVSIAFPAISTGAFGYPRGEAALIVRDVLATTLAEITSIREVRLVFFSAGDAQLFQRTR